MPGPRTSSRLSRLGALTLFVAAVVFARLVLVASREVVVRLSDFGWFWLPLRAFSWLDSPARMRLAWTREPWPVEGLAELAGAGLASLLAHLPIVLLVWMILELAFGRRADDAVWLSRAATLLVLPDAVLFGFEAAVAAGLDGWARRAAMLAVAGTFVLLLRLLASRMARRLDRTPWLSAVGLVLAGLALSVTTVGGLLRPEAQERPNILLVSIDSLRADHVASYGYDRPTSPTIDRLAREGVRFDVVSAPSSWTLPSHMTLVTGLPPRVHGVVDSDRRLSGRVETIAERLAEHGYYNMALVSGRYLDASYGYPQGFESYDDYTLDLLLQRLGAQRRVTSTAIETLVDRRLRAWFDRHSESRPFFLFLHLFDVHFDYIPPPPFDELYVEEEARPIDHADFAHNESVHTGMPAEELSYVVSQYDGEIRATDALIGSLLSTLEQLGVLDETIVAVTSDHGEEFFEHGNKGHRTTLYEESVRVPLVLRYPARVPAGMVVSDPVALQDVAPTLLGLAGIREPFGLVEDGAPWSARDLSARLTRGAGASPSPAGGYLFASLRERTYSVRSDRFKLILDLTSEPPAEELFRLDIDPGETENVLSAYPEVAEELRGVLSAYLMLETEQAGRARRELSDEMRRDLEALGYLD